jgi:hypothetical protein
VIQRAVGSPTPEAILRLRNNRRALGPRSIEMPVDIVDVDLHHQA